MSDSSATQASETVVTKTARHSVEDTVAKLSELVKGRGLTLFAIVDHSGEARRIGLALPRHQIGDLRQSRSRHAGDASGPTPRARPPAQGARLGQRRRDEGELHRARYSSRPATT